MLSTRVHRNKRVTTPCSDLFDGARLGPSENSHLRRRDDEIAEGANSVARHCAAHSIVERTAGIVSTAGRDLASPPLLGNATYRGTPTAW